MSNSSFRSVKLAPADPILGLTEMYKSDTKPEKVNLGVGVYYNDSGSIPLLDCVRAAEADLVSEQAPRAYQPIDGNQKYAKLVQDLLFGEDSNVIKERRVLTAQTLGGTGALRMGAELLSKSVESTGVWISDPSWANHRGIFTNAGMSVHTYPYYSAESHSVAFDEMKDSLNSLMPGSVVLLHACCHNPTGVDLTKQQWEEIAQLVSQKNLIPFLDIAYQGFGDSVKEDGSVVRLFAKTCRNVLIANSFSKSFSLYGERIGGLSIIADSNEEMIRLQSQLKILIRTNYSSAPIYSGAIVEKVLGDKDLCSQWDRELGEMRDRIKQVRAQLVNNIQTLCPNKDYSFIVKQRGMFSYSGLTKDQVVALREKHSVYAVESGRICVAALNSTNIEYVSNAIAAVIG